MAEPYITLFDRASNRIVELEAQVKRLREALMVVHHCLVALNGSPLVSEAVETIEEALSGAREAGKRADRE